MQLGEPDLRTRLLVITGLMILLLVAVSAGCSAASTSIQTTTKAVIVSTTTITTTTPEFTTTPTSTVVTLVSVDIEPASASLHIGSTQQFTARAIYSDGTTSDVTYHVSWKSDNTGVIVSGMGVASGTTLGSAHIKATYSGITSKSAVLTLVDSMVAITTPASTTAIFITTTTPAKTVTTPTTSVTIVIPTTTKVVTTPPGQINSATGVYGNYYLGLVDTPSGIIGDDGCYDDTGNFIVLINNKNAANPTYAQLLSFLQSDTTDKYPYVFTGLSSGSYYGSAESHVDLKRIQKIIDGTAQPSPPDVCGDFAERLHNDAEMAGIKCAYVSIDLSGYTDQNNYGIGSNVGHALDAFQTTDKGLIFIDDTGVPSGSPGPSRCVKTVNAAVGQAYIPVSLFPESGWSSTWDSMGTVADMQVVWDGTWNN